MRAIHTIHTRETARACRATTSTRIPWALAALLVAACSGGSDDNANPADAAVAADAPPNTLTEAEQAAGWQLLFDGETTTAWRGYNQEAFPDTGWAVVDGALVVGATATDPDVAIGGDIVTTESFTDFDLKFEFMLSEVANSGVLYRVIEEEGAAIWHNAPEYQVLDDPAYIEMGTMDMNTHLTGDNYDLHASGETTLHGPGEWNSGRIRVQNNVVEHWLNGAKTVEYELGSPEWEALVAASKGTVVSGGQAEVAPPDLFSGGIYESYGRGWLVQPDPALDAALRMGDWNTMRVRAVGDRVTTWLNGTRMVDFDDEKIGEAEGSIALQIHDGGGIKVRWRNLRVVDLGG